MWWLDGGEDWGLSCCFEKKKKKKKESFFTSSQSLSSLSLSSLSLSLSPSLLPLLFSSSLSYLPGPDPEVVRRAPVQARVEHPAVGRHRDVVSDDLEADGRLRAAARAHVAVAQPRGELDQRRVLEGGLAGGVTEDLVLDGGRAGAGGAGGEGDGAVFFGGGGSGERGGKGGGRGWERSEWKKKQVLSFFFSFCGEIATRASLLRYPSSLRERMRPFSSEFRSPLFTDAFA